MGWIECQIRDQLAAESKTVEDALFKGNVILHEGVTIPVDYNDPAAAIVPEGATYANQAQWDEALGSAPCWKYLSDVIRALPLFVTQEVTIQVAAGIQRFDPGVSGWSLVPMDKSFVMGSGKIIIEGAPISSGTALASAAVSAVSTSEPPCIEFPASSFPNDGSFKGRKLELADGQILTIQDHTDSRLYTMEVPSPLPAVSSTATVRDHATVFRNSMDDVSTYRLYVTLFDIDGKLPGGEVWFKNICFDNFSGEHNVTAWGRNCYLYFEHCLFDQETCALGGQGAVLRMQSKGSWGLLRNCAHINTARGSQFILDAKEGAKINATHSYLQGSAHAIICGSDGAALLFTHVVFDAVGSPSSVDASITVYEGSYVMFQEYGTGKRTEIKGSPSAGFHGIALDSGELETYGIGLIMSDIQGDCVVLREHAKVVEDRSGGGPGILDGGGCQGVGFAVEGPWALLKLDASSPTTMTGVAGDTRDSEGVVRSYSSLETASPVADGAFNYLRKG